MFTTTHRKYHPVPPIDMPVRHWPDRVLTRAPRWCSTDLRDGNQALAIPMNPQRKTQMFHMLLRLGFREIEAGFPAASQDEFAFVRQLSRSAPADVAIQVLTSAREEHIRQTFASLEGAPRAIVHFYLSTSPLQRQVVFGVDEATLIQRAVSAATLIRTLAERQPDTRWHFQFSPESFSATELEFALAISEAVIAVWEPTPHHPVILNLPATVEVASPNRFADQIEWMDRHLSRRDAVVLSIHPHNDRGCGVAAAELALLAGAQRVEGALFGNGERTGNLDVITLAMNLYSQGIDPGLDFSNMNALIECYQSCTGMEVAPRHPYAGALVFTAFSGSHQDAIRKGLAAMAPTQGWQVPYLPIDPRDIGFDLDGVIRVNSQSGKGGAAFLLARERGVTLPRWMEPEFAREVQKTTEHSGREMTAPEIVALFDRTMLHPPGGIHLQTYRLLRNEPCRVELHLLLDGQPSRVTGQGNGPIDAACHALTGPWRIHRYEERALRTGSDAPAIAFIQLAIDHPCAEWSGAGIDEDIIAASFHALIAAINRHLATCNPEDRLTLFSHWNP
ncbi:MAG: 2-isopropylmalate synthase [Magnetococcales bacterium]|nr:2-isopropylmalate synthase [Magnetococcales bacterium]MBF0151064.1 2-isopropylmalate synthase [Magnetococcales bacterium]MBF0174737.1 2-isopropylmalate synthase [Magnetococcales bacterium]MBF0347273.1 2-isopropylmalate synthase [Magnetococcales bacterium]MBF0631592.1 2-isopropylmalate synthase [Magnetococcales bacterium]